MMPFEFFFPEKTTCYSCTEAEKNQYCSVRYARSHPGLLLPQEDEDMMKAGIKTPLAALHDFFIINCYIVLILVIKRLRARSKMKKGEETMCGF
jgi:hypothetical protein